MELEVAIRTAHPDTVFLEVGEVAAGEKGDRDAGLGELGPVVHAEGPGSDHGGRGESGKGAIRGKVHARTLNKK